MSDVHRLRLTDRRVAHTWVLLYAPQGIPVGRGVP